MPPVLLEDVTGFDVSPSGLACKGVGNSWVSKGFVESLCTEQWKIMRLRSRAVGKPRRARPSASVKKKLAADFRPKNSYVILKTIGRTLDSEETYDDTV